MGDPHSLEEEQVLVAAMVAQWEYTPQDDTEIELLEGDVVIDVDPVEEGWSVGRNERTGIRGLVPSNYIEPRLVPAVQLLIAQYDFPGDEDGEISLADGDIISEALVVMDGWMAGKNETTGESGLFPSNYVEPRKVPTVSSFNEQQQEQSLGESPEVPTAVPEMRAATSFLG